MSASVNIFNNDGSVTVYKKLSERLPEFHEKYPIGEGYRLISTSQDFLSKNPGLLMIAEKLIEKGVSLDEIQQSIPLNRQLFICELRDETNEIVASASALKVISKYKDYETGETAALQRLLAKLGFGGEVFDDDEQADFADQDIQLQPESTPTKATVSEIPTVKDNVSDKQAQDKLPPETASNVSPALLRQLKLQAELIGEPCPTVTTNAQAKAALKKIRSKQK